MRTFAFAFALSIAAVAGCGGDDGTPAVQPDLTVEQAGPHAVGVRSLMLDDSAHRRTLPALVFYPAQPPAAPEAGLAIEMLESEPRQSAYAHLLADAPPACPTHTLDASLDAAVAAGRYPLVVVSHCLDCT